LYSHSNVLSSACNEANMDIENGVDVSDTDYDDDDDDDGKLFDVNGGSIYIGVMAPRVSRMQCGVSVTASGSIARRPAQTPVGVSAAVDRFVVRKTPLPSRLCFKQHVNVW